MTALVVALGAAVAMLTLLVVGLLRSHAEILRRMGDPSTGSPGGATSASPVSGSTPSTSPAPSDAATESAAGTAAAPHFRDPPDAAPHLRDPGEAVRSGSAAVSPATDLRGLRPDGTEAVSVQIAGVDHDTVLAFLSAGCVTCQGFWDAFRSTRDLRLPATVRLVVVTKGPEAERDRAIAGLAPADVPTIMSTEAFEQYDVPGSPYFVRVHGPTGQVVARGTGSDWAQVSATLLPS